jgi:hypothetical protein
MCEGDNYFENEIAILPPWRRFPRPLINWWEMNEFALDKLQLAWRLLEHLSTIYTPIPPAGDAMFSRPEFFDLNTRQRFGMKQSFGLVADALRNAGLSNAAQAAIDVQPDLNTEVRFTNQNAVDRVAEIIRAIQREMKGNIFLYVDSVKAEFYRDANLFGAKVEDRFPRASGDISEAGKCLALDRPTACVFHLMRVMEVGLQEFSSALGVFFPQDNNWQAILDHTNKAIKAMDHKQSKTRQYAEAAAHLYNVKVAWRNSVMHPKETYTWDEAKQIFGNVQTFVSDLSALI